MYKKRLPIGNLFPTVQSFNNIVKYYNNLKIQKNIITTYQVNELISCNSCFKILKLHELHALKRVLIFKSSWLSVRVCMDLLIPQQYKNRTNLIIQNKETVENH